MSFPPITDIITTSLTEVKYDTYTTAPALTSLSLSPLLHPLLLSSPLFSAHPSWSRQMSAHIESGSARGFIQLMRELFFSLAKVFARCGNSMDSLSFWRPWPHYAKCRQIMFAMIWCYTNKTEWKWIELHGCGAAQRNMDAHTHTHTLTHCWGCLALLRANLC